MSMPLHLAEALSNWWSKAAMGAYERAGQSEYGKLLDLANSAVVDHALQRAWPLYLTPRGWVIPLACIESDVDEARRLVKQAADAAEAKKQAPPAETPKLLEPPPDSIAWPICNEAEAQAQISIDDRRRERQRILNAIVAEPTRYLPHASSRHIRAVRALHLRFPNFQPVIDVIARHLRLLELTECALRLPPILLLGPPGVGKTEFVRALSLLLDMPLCIQSMAEATAGFVLTGSHGTWAESGPGIVIRHIADCPQGKAPLILLDEFDKASGDRYHRCDTALLGLLEPTTARAFRDENLSICMDARPLSFLLTANRIGDIRPEVLSRVRIIKIAVPTQEQMPAVVRSLDEAIRRDTGDLNRLFAPLDQAVIDCLSARPPRDLKRLLLDGYALVAERTTDDVRMHLRPEHFEELEGRSAKAEILPKPYVMPLMVDGDETGRVH